MRQLEETTPPKSPFVCGTTTTRTIISSNSSFGERSRGSTFGASRENSSGRAKETYGSSLPVDLGLLWRLMGGHFLSVQSNLLLLFLKFSLAQLYWGPLRLIMACVCPSYQATYSGSSKLMTAAARCPIFGHLCSLAHFFLA